MSEDDFLWPPDTFEDPDDPDLVAKLQHSFDIVFAQLRRLQSSAGGGSGPHSILSATHDDSLVAVAVDGDLLRRNASKWERLGIGIAGQVLLTVLGLPAWSYDGHSLLIDAGHVDTGTLPTARYPHNLLSTPHSDTTPASAVLGDMVLAQAAAAADLDAYWLDGLPFDDLPNVVNAGDELYWLDGLPTVALEIAGTVAWQRKANSPIVGYVWTAGAVGPDWQPASSGSSLGAAVYRASDFSLADTLPTKVDLSTVVFDDGTFWASGTPSRLTIPVGAGGAYVITGLATWASGQPGNLYAYIYVNGVKRASSNLSGASAVAPYFEPALVTTIVKLNAGDYVELYVEQAANVAGTAYIVKGGTTNTFLQLGRLNSESVASTGLPSPVAGAIIKGNVGGTAYDRVLIGAAGSALKSDGAAPVWTSIDGEFTSTTTGNIDDLDFTNLAVIRMNNATLSTIRGLKAGIAGQRVAIVSVGAGEVDLAHQNAGSAAANRLINTNTAGVMPLAPGSGAAIYEYDLTTARWRLIAFFQGLPIAVPYAAGDFSSTGGATWTVDAGDVTNFQYIVGPGYIEVWFDIRLTSTTLNPGALDIKCPGGVTISGATTNCADWGYDNGIPTGTLVQPAHGSGAFTDSIRVFRQDLVAWANAVNATQVRGFVKIPVS